MLSNDESENKQKMQYTVCLLCVL